MSKELSEPLYIIAVRRRELNFRTTHWSTLLPLGKDECRGNSRLMLATPFVCIH